jgi:hypothetical protein
VERGHADGPGVVREERTDGVPGRGERLVHAHGRRGERLAGLREHQPPPALDGERHRDAGLQRGELLRDGGRAHVHRDRQRRDAAPVAELAQEAEAGGIHEHCLTHR